MAEIMKDRRKPSKKIIDLEEKQRKKDEKETLLANEALEDERLERARLNALKKGPYLGTVKSPRSPRPTLASSKLDIMQETAEAEAAERRASRNRLKASKKRAQKAVRAEEAAKRAAEARRTELVNSGAPLEANANHTAFGHANHTNPAFGPAFGPGHAAPGHAKWGQQPEESPGEKEKEEEEEEEEEALDALGASESFPQGASWPQGSPTCVAAADLELASPPDLALGPAAAAQAKLDAKEKGEKQGRGRTKTRVKGGAKRNKGRRTPEGRAAPEEAAEGKAETDGWGRGAREAAKREAKAVRQAAKEAKAATRKAEQGRYLSFEARVMPALEAEHRDAKRKQLRDLAAGLWLRSPENPNHPNHQLFLLHGPA